MTISLTNTMTRRKDRFEPIDPDDVRMYICGPTVYDRAHLGNARPAVVFDVLFRLLRHTYGAEHVTYVRNFTDVDDKINATAQARKEAGAEGTLEQLIAERTEETIGWYLDDMGAVGVMHPNHMPRATSYIDHMIEMIEILIEKGHAYEAAQHVLFSVDSYDHYGWLSGRSVEDMIAGSRVEVAPYKKNPMDFVLWKPSDDDLPGWDSPWGRGRPGWHIECSAMSHELLGKSFDIHGGGNDLIFPHHENEIAQSRCTYPDGDFAHVWLHNEMLQVEGKKMSKSLGNFFTVHDLLSRDVPGEVIRFVLLSTHYRKPMDWTEKKREEAEKTLRRWHRLLDPVQPGQPDPDILAALSDDLNTASALNMLGQFGQALFQKAGATWDFHDDLRQDQDWMARAGEVKASAQLLGFLMPDMGDWAASPDLAPWARRLADLRAAAMESKDFSGVDDMKAALVAAGVEVRISKEGVALTPGTGFDLKKLQDL